MSTYFKILRSDSSDLESSNPFFIWKRVFSELFVAKYSDSAKMHFHKSAGHHVPLHSSREADERQDREHVLSQLIECIGREATEKYHPLLNPVLNWNYKDTEDTKELKGEMRNTKTLEFLQSVLASYAGSHKKLVFMFENIHWIDSMSFQLLLLCCDSPMMWFLLTSRTGVSYESLGSEGGRSSTSGTQEDASGASFPPIEPKVSMSKTSKAIQGAVAVFAESAVGAGSLKSKAQSTFVSTLNSFRQDRSTRSTRSTRSKERSNKSHHSVARDTVGNSVVVVAQSNKGAPGSQKFHRSEKARSRSSSGKNFGSVKERRSADRQHAPRVDHTQGYNQPKPRVMDDSSMSALERVNSTASREFKTDSAAHEDFNDSTLFGALIHEKEAICIVLGSIDRDALHEHVCHLLDCSQASEELMAMVEKRAGGNFLYVQEFINSVNDAGLLIRQDDIITVESEDTLAVPERIEALISSRVDALSPSQQYLLRTAAAIGRSFKLDMLIDVHPNTDMLGTLEKDVKELLRKRFIEFIDEDKFNELQFCHTYVQEAVYQSALVDTQKQIHRSCAQYYEIYFVEDLAPHFGSIARHYLAAAQWQQAAHYSVLASTFAIENNLYESTIEFVDMAQRLIDKLGKRHIPTNCFKSSQREQAHLHFQAATARFATGNERLAIKHFELCIRTYGYRVLKGWPWVKLERMANITILQIYAYKNSQHSLVTEQLAAINTDTESYSMLSEAFLNLGTLHHMQGGNKCLEKHVSFVMKAAKFARKDGVSTRVLIKVLCEIINIGMNEGWQRIVDYCLHETNRLCALLDDTGCDGMNYSVIALKHAYSGDLAQCTKALEEAKKLCWDERLLDWWSMALICHAWSMFEAGEGWEAIGMLKNNIGDALSTRNFFVFERLCVFILPYLWELDIELGNAGEIVQGGDCFWEWYQYFVEQSQVISLDVIADRSRRSFRFHIDMRGKVICAAKVLRDIKHGFYQVAAEEALELCKDSSLWPQDSMESLFMGLPIYELVTSLCLLHQEHVKPTKVGHSSKLDDYIPGTFLKSALQQTSIMEKNATALISKPWSMLCRCHCLVQQNLLQKAITKLEVALKIASHHNMQTCMGYIYLLLANTEKRVSDNGKFHIRAKPSMKRRSVQESPGLAGNVSTREVEAVGGRRLSGNIAPNLVENDEQIYLAHARAAVEISENCGCVHVYYEANKLMKRAKAMTLSTSSHASSHRTTFRGNNGGRKGSGRLSAFVASIPSTMNGTSLMASYPVSSRKRSIEQGGRASIRVQLEGLGLDGSGAQRKNSLKVGTNSESDIPMGFLIEGETLRKEEKMVMKRESVASQKQFDTTLPGQMPNEADHGRGLKGHRSNSIFSKDVADVTDFNRRVSLRLGGLGALDSPMKNGAGDHAPHHHPPTSKNMRFLQAAKYSAPQSLALQAGNETTFQQVNEDSKKGHGSVSTSSVPSSNKSIMPIKSRGQGRGLGAKQVSVRDDMLSAASIGLKKGMSTRGLY